MWYGSHLANLCPPERKSVLLHCSQEHKLFPPLTNQYFLTSQFIVGADFVLQINYVFNESIDSHETGSIQMYTLKFNRRFFIPKSVKS